MEGDQPVIDPKSLQMLEPSYDDISEAEPSTSASPPPYRPVRAAVAARVRYPQKRYVPQADRNTEEHITNQKKQRYWNSWEELYIVELWRRYRDEVTILNVPLPVYRKMMITMRNKDMMVTAQDCRRKVNTLNTRYRQELKKMESSGCKSDWRLFPLIHCIMSPKVKVFDACHEMKVIKKLMDKLPRPKPVEVTPPPPPPPPQPTPAPVVVNNQPARAVQVNNQPPRSIQHNNHPPRSSQLNSNIPRIIYSHSYINQFNTNLTPQLIQNIQSLTRASNARLAYQQSMPAAVQPKPLLEDTSTNKLHSNQANFKKPSILHFRNLSWEKIEQLRLENKRLSVERDENLESLHLEQKAFKSFELYVRSWKAKMEAQLHKVKKLTEDCVIKTENQENHDVEQQLQDTVAAN